MTSATSEHHPHLRCRLHVHKWVDDETQGHHEHHCAYCEAHHEHTSECGPLGLIGGA